MDFPRKKVKFRTRKKRALVTGMKEWIEGESQKGVSDKARSIAREIRRRTQNQVEMPAETPSTLPKKIESQSIWFEFSPFERQNPVREKD